MSTDAAVEIPVERLTRQPSVLPDRCVRHGLPAVRRVDLAVRSRPNISRRRRLLVPGYTAVNRAEEYVSQVKVTRVRDWPLCADCVRTHAIGVALAAVLFFGGLAAMAIAVVVGALADGSQPLLALPLLGGFASMLVAVLPLRWGSYPRLTQAWTTDDGAAVRVADPHPEFTAGLSGGR